MPLLKRLAPSGREMRSLRSTLLLLSLLLSLLLMAMLYLSSHLLMGRMLLSERGQHENNTLEQLSRQMELVMDNLEGQLWLFNTSNTLNNLASTPNTTTNRGRIVKYGSELALDALNNFGHSGLADKLLFVGRNGTLLTISFKDRRYDLSYDFPYQPFASDSEISPYFTGTKKAMWFQNLKEPSDYNAVMKPIHQMLEGRAGLVHAVRNEENVILGVIYVVLDASFFDRVISPFAQGRAISVFAPDGQMLWQSEETARRQGDIFRSVRLSPFVLTAEIRVSAQGALGRLRMPPWQIAPSLAILLAYTLLISGILTHMIGTPLHKMARSISTEFPRQLPPDVYRDMRFFKRLSLKNMLMLYFALTVTLPTLAFGLYLGLQNYGIYQNTVLSHAMTTTRHMRSSIDLRLSYLGELSKYLTNDPAVRKLSSEISDSGLEEAQRDRLDALSKRARIRSNQLLFFNIYHIQGRSLYSSLYPDNQPVTVFGPDFLVKMRLSGSSFVYIGRMAEPYPNAPLMFCVPLTGLEKGKTTRWGYLTMQFDQSVLATLTQRIRLEQTGYFFLLDEDGTVIEHDRSRLTESLLEGGGIEPILRGPSGFGMLSSGGRSYHIHHVQSEQSGIRIVGVVPQEELLMRMLPIVMISLALCLVYLALSVVTARRAARQITKPLTRLRRLMAEAEDGILGEMEYKTPNEIGVLVRQYNHMVLRLGELIKENYRVRLHESQLLLAEREAQLKALQQQINPHFLYNTLDAIKWMAYKKGALEAYEMAIALGNFFRGVISQEKNVVSLQEEIEHLKNYIYIQQIRFGSRFEIRWEVEEEALSLPTLKMVLQPLVENAIIHGMENMEENGLIVIRVARQGHWLTYQVEDNGAGMPAGVLETINRQLAQEDPGKGADSIGLINVLKRLKLHFGASVSMHIQSAPGKGTRVQIRFPIVL